MGMKRIKECLKTKADEAYKAFFCRLVPTIDPNRVLGVRKPELVCIARSLSKEEKEEFLLELPHRYVEEDLLHVHLLNQKRDSAQLAQAVDAFLPCLNSWAIVDGLTLPKANRDFLLKKASMYLDDPREYVKRLGMLWILKYGLNRTDTHLLLSRAMNAQPETDQLVKMKGWLLCETWIKNQQTARSFLKTPGKISDPVFLCAVSKCVDSLRISEQDKQELRALRTLRKAGKRCRQHSFACDL